MIKRTITKSLRFSLAEYESINLELEKTNLSFSSFTRNLLLKKKINSKTDDKLILEINRIGNNLNQIAYVINLMKLNGSLNLSDNMLSEIQTFNAMLRDLSRMQEKLIKKMPLASVLRVKPKEKCSAVSGA
jgi:hypothetical protein